MDCWQTVRVLPFQGPCHRPYHHLHPRSLLLGLPCLPYLPFHPAMHPLHQHHQLLECHFQGIRRLYQHRQKQLKVLQYIILLVFQKLPLKFQQYLHLQLVGVELVPKIKPQVVIELLVKFVLLAMFKPLVVCLLLVRPLVL